MYHGSILYIVTLICVAGVFAVIRLFAGAYEIARQFDADERDGGQS